MSQDLKAMTSVEPHIDELWAALESDDDLVSPQEVALIDSRLMSMEDKEQCLDWDLVRQYIFLRQKFPTRSR